MPKPAARRALTEKGIAALKPQPGKRVSTFDTVVPAMCVRVTESGVKSFAVVTRFQDRQRWITIGKVGSITLAEARDAAREAIAKARRGEDPGAKPPPRREVETFAKVSPRFIAEYAQPRNRAWRETERIFQVYVAPAWGPTEVAAITRRDVFDLAERVARDHGPIMSNRTLAAIRKLFAWCAEREIVPMNVCTGVSPVGKETSRDRVLDDEELRAFWSGTGDLGQPWRTFLRVLLLTGQRLGEVAGMRWQDIDLNRAIWTLPREMTKTDRRHEVPLAPSVATALGAMPRLSGPFVFSTGDGSKAIKGFSGAKRGLDSKMPGVTGWRLHDLRRTTATGMARLGVAPHVVEKVLNHSSGTFAGVAGVYNRHGFEAEKRQALIAWAAHVLKVVELQ